MCIFCAAIPATLAIGANAHARQRRQQKQAEMDDQPMAETASGSMPEAGALTAIAVAGLVVASAIYHTQQGG